MMEHYISVKKENPDVIILYRLGDFYECFFEDAKLVSKELQLVLTGKAAGQVEKVPMCGVPHHALSNYLLKLINNGYKVGIVEQMEDPSTAKGLVKRDIVQIITPGTLIEAGLNEERSNYILCFDEYDDIYTFAYADISTGELAVKSVIKDMETLLSEITPYQTKEIVLQPESNFLELKEYCLKNNILVSYQAVSQVTLFYEQYIKELKDSRHCQTVIRLIDYLRNTQKREIDYLRTAEFIKNNKFVVIDAFSRRNLELSRTLRSSEKHGSLLWVIDKCKTAMGSRLLNSWINFPLIEVNEINERLDYTQSFVNDYISTVSLSKLLMDVYDIERLIAKIGYGNVNPRDMLQLKQTLMILPNIKKLLIESKNPLLIKYADSIKDFKGITDLLKMAIADNPPLILSQGGYIKKGYDDQLDKLKDLAQGGKEYIAELENRERNKTGIKMLKVGYNKVTGFFIEISKGQLEQVKEEFEYTRRQTLINAERFITPELKEKEEEILLAEEKSLHLEAHIFEEIRLFIKKSLSDLQELSKQLAFLDVILSFATTATLNQYVRPTFNDIGVYEVREGRHPVIEKVIGHQGYVPNDILMHEKKVLLITGPNMGGKSTYMRQVALTTILAQIGCYVPCKSANLPIIDKIFTRIGASDDLVSGQSTFMVEMHEANLALKNATSNSLILFDEIGRGTSTYDGLALAKAIIEHLATNINAYTLFSTHYHELTNMDESIPNLKNVSVGVVEENDKVTFLYKILEGPATKSYGLNVARLAHIDETLIKRAKQILKELELNKKSNSTVIYEIIEKEVLPEELRKIDPLTMSPMEALNFLYKLLKK
jgi:DNA mismatch repair protein MutS